MCNRAILPFVFLLFVTGCSGYRPAITPGAVDPAQASDDAPILTKGMIARIHFKSGETLQGEIVRIEPDFVVVGRASNYGFEETVIALDDIDWVEVEATSKVASVAMGTIGGVTIALASVAVVLLLFLDFGPMD